MDRVGDKGLEALTAMLENNYDLERLVVSSAATSIKQGKGGLYCMPLNKVGRGEFVESWQGHSRTVAVGRDAYISCRNDLDCLFHFTQL
jgi:hypothetical protein